MSKPTPAEIRRQDRNLRHVEANYAPGIVGKDFPDDVICDGTPHVIDRLVQEADEQNISVRAAWNWLREDMTTYEAFAWLEA